MCSAAACRDTIDFYRRTLFSLGHSGRSSGTTSHLTKGIFTGSKTWQKNCLIVGCTTYNSERKTHISSRLEKERETEADEQECSQSDRS